MKIFIPIIGLILVMMAQALATDVSGDVWGVWSRENSPYVIVGDVRVPPESTLVVEAGVTVIGNVNYTINVDSGATLKALGTPSDTVTFVRGKGIKFNYSSENCLFQYCRLDSMGSFSFEPVGPFGPIEVRVCSLTIRHCSFNHNYSFGDHAQGGALYLNNSNSLIESCSFRANHAAGRFNGLGGAIYCENSDPNIRYCELAFNTLNRLEFAWTNCMGGAMYLEYSHAILEKNIIYENYVNGGLGFGGGAGVFCYHSSPTLTNNTITKNTAIFFDPFGQPEDGIGGIEGWASAPIIRNCIIWGNHEIDIGGQSLSADIDYSDTGQDTLGRNNISSVPLFVDAAFDDFRLLPYSPCIDAGDPNSPLDPDSTRADIGALPYDHRVAVENEPGLSKRIALLQNYPNPFNAQTTISYTLPQSGPVTLSVYNLLGQRVATLFEGMQQAGEHKAVWEAAGAPSGVYFYRLAANEYVETRKMVVIR